MKFVEINTTTTSKQDIRIFDSRPYDLDCKFTLDSQKQITELTISLTDPYNNLHEIKSAVFCSNKIPNNKTCYYLLINMQQGNYNKAITLKPGTSAYPSIIKMNTGDLIFTNIYEFDDNEHEIKSCSDIDVLMFDINPDHKDGSIIIGRP